MGDVEVMDEAIQLRPDLTPIEEGDYLAGVRRRRDDTWLEIMQLERRLGDAWKRHAQLSDELCKGLPGPVEWIGGKR